VPDGRPVASLPAAELSRAVGYDVPTLAQALSLDTQIIWNLEIKTPAAQDPAIAMLRSVPDKERLLITSFHHLVAAAFCEQLNVDCGFLVAHRPLRVDGFGAQADTPLKTIVWNFETVDSDAIRASADLGFRNFVYGVSTREEHTELAGWKLDGVITDEPGFVRCA
jgi:glycerophosphoryl diester phosphodiesterase